MNDRDCTQAVNSARLLSQSGQYRKALASYQNAYVAKPVPWLLVNIGRLQQRLGDLKDAVVSFHRFLDQEVAQAYPVHRVNAQRFLAEAERDIAAQQALARRAALTESHGLSKGPLPVYKRWWFWTVVGVAVAGTALGVGLGTYAREPDLTGVPIIQALRK